MPPSFGQLVKAHRLDAGLTLRQLAERSSLDFTYLSKIEGSKVRPPTRESVEGLALALRLDVEQREALDEAAGRIGADFEQWVVREPRARALYRSLQQLDPTDQGRLLDRLLDQVEREVSDGAAPDGPPAAPDGASRREDDR